MEIKDIIKKARAEKGLKQEDIAREIGISHRMYQRYEEGKFPKYKSDSIQKLDIILNTNICELLYDKNVPREKIDELKTNSGIITERLVNIISRQNDFLQRIVESNLVGLSQDLRELYNEQVKTRAELRGYEQRHIYKEVDWDTQKFLTIMAEVGRLTEANLKSEQQSGS